MSRIYPLLRQPQPQVRHASPAGHTEWGSLHTNAHQPCHHTSCALLPWACVQWSQRQWTHLLWWQWSHQQQRQSQLRPHPACQSCPQCPALMNCSTTSTRSPTRPQVGHRLKGAGEPQASYASSRLQEQRGATERAGRAAIVYVRLLQTVLLTVVMPHYNRSERFSSPSRITCLRSCQNGTEP